MKLDTVNSIPAEEFADSVHWGENVYVINENCYGVEMIDKQLRLSHEHTEYKWMNYNDTMLVRMSVLNMAAYSKMMY